MTQLSAGSAVTASIQGINTQSNEPTGYFQIQTTAAAGYVVNASYSASAEL
jgi:hypothetical protein